MTQDPGANFHNLVQTSECLALALSELDPFDQDLILRYYAASGSDKDTARNDLAKRLNLSLENLRIRAVRIRKSLEQSISKCLSSPLHRPTESEIAEIVPVIEQIKKLEPELISHLKNYSDDLLKIRPTLFEHLFAEFLAAQAFDDVRLVGRNPNTSADIYAAKQIVGPEINLRLFVEVKRWKGKALK